MLLVVLVLSLFGECSRFDANALSHITINVFLRFICICNFTHFDNHSRDIKTWRYVKMPVKAFAYLTGNCYVVYLTLRRIEAISGDNPSRFVRQSWQRLLLEKQPLLPGEMEAHQAVFVQLLEPKKQLIIDDRRQKPFLSLSTTLGLPSIICRNK